VIDDGHAVAAAIGEFRAAIRPRRRPCDFDISFTASADGGVEGGQRSGWSGQDIGPGSRSAWAGSDRSSGRDHRRAPTGMTGRQAGLRRRSVPVGLDQDTLKLAWACQPAVRGNCNGPSSD